MRQLPDTSVAQGWRSSVFLFRQPFLSIPGVIATIGVAVWLGDLMIAKGHTTPADFAKLALIAPLCGFGFAVLTALPLFMLTRAFREKREFTAKQGESVLLRERANHFLRHEGRGGELVVTNQRLFFLPHRFNVQLDVVEQSIERVRELEWTRVVGAAGLPLSNILHVRDEQRVERYVVKDALSVGECIEAAARKSDRPLAS